MARSLAQSKKKGPPQHEDVFVERILQATTWAQENAPIVIVSTVLLALGLAGVFYYRNYRASVRQQAAVELQALTAEVGGLDRTTAAGRIEGFVARFDGTDAAAEARVLLARVRLEAGETEGALETLRPLMERPPDTPIGYAAHRLAAAAHEARDEPAPALRLYARLGTEARLPFQRRASLADRARLLADTGALAEAAALYEDLARRAEEADALEEAAVYRLRLGELRAAAVSGTGAASADGGPDTIRPRPGPTAEGGDA